MGIGLVLFWLIHWLVYFGVIPYVRIGYVVSDLEGDSVRLRVEYSVNGVASNKTMYIKIYNDGTDSTLGVNLSLGAGLHQGIMTRTIGGKVVG